MHILQAANSRYGQHEVEAENEPESISVGCVPPARHCSVRETPMDRPPWTQTPWTDIPSGRNMGPETETPRKNSQPDMK